MKKKFVSVLSLVAAVSMAQAADINWTGGTADYTNTADWVGGVVPGVNDNAINDNGSNNAVQISVGNPDWLVNQIRAGNGAGNGAFIQNGQAVTLIGTNNGSGINTSLRLGLASGDTGVYTLNGGSINYSNGSFSVGELGTGILNVNGGTITGSGNFADNLGVPANPVAVNATVGGGTAETDFTWFEQGLSADNPSLGLPAAGTTITSLSQPADHSYTLPPSYTANNAVLVSANVLNATITMTSPTPVTGLSFMGTSGNGATTVNYVVHHADSTTESGSLTIPDWFGPGTANEVMAVASRVDALGINFQFPGPVTGFTGNAPYLWSLDIPITDTASAVTSVDLTYTGGGVASILAVSTQTTGGGVFAPVTISGFNEDVVVEAGAPHVSNSVTDIVTQVNGSINVSGEMWVGNGGVGVYNLSGGTLNASNFLVTGRGGGNGTFNMTGGTINKSGSAFAISTRTGGASVGTVNQSGGTINSSSEYWIGQGDGTSAGATATNNVSGAAVINLTNWLAVGREGGVGVLNISGGTITKTGNGNLTITHGTGASGTVNQSGGTITIAVGDVWIGEDSAAGTWNMNGGTAVLGNVLLAKNNSASGTLNLNGGVFQAHEVISPTAGTTFTMLNFNGGTLQANVDNTTFISGLFSATIGASGAVIDSQGFNITVPQELDDNGGGTLTKLGSGTLTLSGPNTYAGPTVVNAGTLLTTTASAASGSYTVADNAGFGVLVQSANAQFNAANVTVGSSTGGSLSFDLDGFGNPAAAPLNVAGTLSLSGNIVINIADGFPQVGQFPLIKYGTLSGSPTFTVGSLPTGVTATVVNNTANNSIDLNFTGVNVPRWEGQAGGNWDIGLTTNWINSGTGLPTVYNNGNPVLFDDNATGTTNVNITTTVSPATLTVNNSNLNYTFTGSGKISGATSLLKQGTNVLSILNTGGNNYTGPTIISNGVLAVTSLANGGSPSAIGASSANYTNLVFAGGTLSYSGPPVTIDRSYFATAGAIDTPTSLTLSGLAGGPGGGEVRKTGSGQLAYTGVGSNSLAAYSVAGTTYRVAAGTVVLDGTAGPQTNYFRNLRLGLTDATNSTLIMTNTSVDVRNGFTVGDHNNATATLIINNTSLVHEGNGNAFDIGDNNGNPVSGVVVQNNSTVNAIGDIWVGQTVNGVGSYTLSSGLISAHSWTVIGRAGSTGVFNMTGGTINKDANGNFLIGSGAGNNALASVGTLNQSGGTINCTNEYWIAENALDYGTNNISGTAVVNWHNWVSIGRHGHGVVNFSGGTINRTDSGSAIVVGDNVGGSGNGFFNQTGGTLTSANELWIGQGGGTVGRYDLSAGSVTVNNWIAIGRGGASGTLNISGGTFTKTGNGGNHLLVGADSPGPGVINQTGGTITSLLSDTYVGNGSTGTWNLSAGAAILGVVHLSQNSGIAGTINLSSNGILSATEITTGNSGGTSTLNLNGGTIAAAGGANPNFLHDLTVANVMSNGIAIDSGTNTIAISQALLDGTGGGGLTKIGNGTLLLNGVDTYTGSTLAKVGALGGTGAIAGPVGVASGAQLAPGGSSIGTLTINNSLTFSNSSSALFRISNAGSTTNNDQVAGLTSVTYSGTLVATNAGGSPLVLGSTFKLFNSASAGSGNFSTVTILPAGSGTFNPATGILTVTSTGALSLNHPFISNGNFVLTGNGDPGTGYTLLNSTNVALPLAQWTTNSTGTFDGSGASSNAIPLDSTNRFFLLRQP